ARMTGHSDEPQALRDSVRVADPSGTGRDRQDSFIRSRHDGEFRVLSDVPTVTADVARTSASAILLHFFRAAGQLITTLMKAPPRCSTFSGARILPSLVTS